MTIVERDRAGRGLAGTLRAALAAPLAAVFLLASAAAADAAPSQAEEIEMYRFATPRDAEMDHFVGAVDDDLFVGIALAEADGDAAEPRTLVVYLCDGRTVSIWIVDEAAGAEASVARGEARIDLTLADDAVTGTVALPGAEPRPFTAEPATGDAGLYRAEWTLAGADYMVNWIVLADGRQRGSLDGKGNDVMIMVPW